MPEIFTDNFNTLQNDLQFTPSSKSRYAKKPTAVSRITFDCIEAGSSAERDQTWTHLSDACTLCVSELWLGKQAT